MTPEAQRIAIAEACGEWSFPLNDLNAMHEAEKVLTERNLFDAYRETLIHVVGWKQFHTATAAQRAEAFLRTLDKWTDEPTKGASREA